MKKNFIIVAASVMALMSCGGGEKLYTEEQLLGEWHEVMPVNKHIVQGMLLDKANKASSVGMATLKYNNWKLVKGKHKKAVLCCVAKASETDRPYSFVTPLI